MLLSRIAKSGKNERLMEIQYIGHASFRIKGKNGSVICDPYDPKATGLKFPKISADIVTISHNHPDHNNTYGVADKILVIVGPGEYEIKGIKVMGLSTFHDGSSGKERGKNTIYRIDIDRVSVVHLGDIGHRLSDTQIDKLGNVDILLIPVGGVYTINPSEAAVIVSQLEPKVIIPMHYKRADLSDKTFGKLADVNLFLKELGKTNIEPMAKFVTTREKLPSEAMVVVLE